MSDRLYDESENRVLLYLGIRPDDASEQDRSLAADLIAILGHPRYRSGHSYVEQAKIMMATDSAGH